MPGYEPFLLCDFHVHTTWSDGRLSVREVIDLYGQTGRFDVIAITDHILMKKDLLARMGRIATVGRRRFGVEEDEFDAYLADIEIEISTCYLWDNRESLVDRTAIKHALRRNVDVALTLYRNGSWTA